MLQPFGATPTARACASQGSVTCGGCIRSETDPLVFETCDSEGQVIIDPFVRVDQRWPLASQFRVENYDPVTGIWSVPPPPDLDRDDDGVEQPLDCNDFDDGIKPGAVEIPGNGRDEDCSGEDASADPEAFDNGDPCVEDAVCASGTCVLGICCTTRCGDGAEDDCQSCLEEETGLPDGECGPLDAGTVCREATGLCDHTEVCDGEGLECGGDFQKQVGEVCRPAVGACDVAETCRGRYGAFNNRETWTSQTVASNDDPITALQTLAFGLHVVDAANAPIANERVALLDSELKTAAVKRTDGNGDGFFEVLPGACMVLELTRLSTTWQSALTCVEVPTSPEVAVPTLLDIATRRFEVNVQTSLGGPLAGAVVRLVRADGHRLASVSTGSDGLAAFEVLPGASASVEVTYRRATLTHPLAELGPDPIVVATRSAAIEVHDSNEAPVQDVVVALADAAGVTIASSRTDSAGLAAFEVLPGAVVRFVVSRFGASASSDALDVADDVLMTRSFVPLSLALTTSTGAPKAGVSVYLREPETQRVWGTAQTDGAGIARFEVLDGSRHVLEASFQRNLARTAATTVDGATTLELRMARVALSLSSSLGLPLSGGAVRLLTPGGLAIVSGTTAADGIFAADLLPGAAIVIEVKRFGQTLLFSGLIATTDLEQSLVTVPLVVLLRKDGAPVINQRVDILPGESGVTSAANLRTDAGGQVLFEVLSGSVYRAQVKVGTVTNTWSPIVAPASATYDL